MTMAKSSMKTNIEPVAIPPDLAALVNDVSGADLPPAPPKLTNLIQAGSADLLDLIEGSAAGDFAVPVPDGYRLVKGATGLAVVPVYFNVAWVEWGADRSGLIGVHATKPHDATWFASETSPSGKAGFHSGDGNKLEQTVYANMLATTGDELFTMTFAFRSSAFNIGRDFAGAAEGVRSIDGALSGAVVGKWKLTSKVEKKLDFRWHAPVLTKLGVFGQTTGPTASEMQTAAELRRGFKEQAKAESAARIASLRSPAIEGPRGGSITIESGRKPAVDPNLNDPIPFG
jgi:hypothetical protein